MESLAMHLCKLVESLFSSFPFISKTCKSFVCSYEFFFKRFFIELLISLLVTFLIFDSYLDLKGYIKYFHTSDKLSINAIIYIIFYLITSILLLVIFYALNLVIDSLRNNSIFYYLSKSVTENKIDFYVYKAICSGNILSVRLNSNEVFLLFPKYSSSYNCKAIENKFLIAYVFKKFRIIGGKFCLYEDNTKELLKQFEIEGNYLFYWKNFNIFRSNSKFFKIFCTHPYPQVPFYQILDEYEERIDFKDIKSISIYRCPQKDEQKE